MAAFDLNVSFLQWLICDQGKADANIRKIVKIDRRNSMQCKVIG